MADRVALILLAAGGSTRLGSAKQLIDVDGEPLVRRATRQLVAINAGPVGVVIGARADAIRDALAGVDATIFDNPHWSAGIGTSIRAGVAWAASIDATHALIALCDQPDIDAAHFAALLAARHDAAIVASRYAGHPGVPAVFARSVFDRLIALPDDRGAKAILNDPLSEIRQLAYEPAAIDLDTPEDLRRWRANAL